MRIISLLILASLIFGQDFGRMITPETEEPSDEIETVEALNGELAIEGVIDPDQYILGPGDEIGLNIQTAFNQTLPLIITPTGDLFIPSVGVCHIAGYSLTQGAEIVRKFVLEKAYPNAEIYMVLVNPRHFLLQVNGAVVEPGFITVTPLMRLHEVIKDAKGFHQLAKEFEILITRSTGKVEVVNYHKFILEGDLASNPTFLEGDKIHVPFGGLEKDGIVVRGSITGTGYDIISKGENLGNYIRRQIIFTENADLQNVSISRTVNGKMQIMVISPMDFSTTILHAQDEISFNWERGVMVNGFVQTPGGFSYYPGYSVADYISLAGGNTIQGNPKRVSILHTDGSTEVGNGVVVRRGDVIFVPRTTKDILLGSTSALGTFTAILTVYLTFLSATR